MVTDLLKRDYPYSMLVFIFSQLHFSHITALLFESMLFTIFLQGGANWMSAHFRATLQIWGRGEFISSEVYF